MVDLIGFFSGADETVGSCYSWRLSASPVSLTRRICRHTVGAAAASVELLRELLELVQFVFVRLPAHLRGDHPTARSISAWATFAEGAPFNPSSDKLPYGIQKYSHGRRCQPTYNALSTSLIGLQVKENIAYGWSLIGVAEAGVNPYSGKLDNQPRSLTDNNARPSGEWPNQTTTPTAAAPANGAIRRAIPSSSLLGFSNALAGFGARG